MKIAFVFAGQGSQTVGMGKDLYQEYEEFRDVFDLLPEKQREIAWNGPEDELNDTGNTQPIMLAFGLGVYQILASHGIQPDMAAGLSLGEYTALAAAGVFPPEEAVSLVTFRAEVMKNAAAGVDPEMTAVMGLSVEMVEELCQKISTEQCRAEITNLNCPGQVIVSGDREAVECVSTMALENGARRCMKLSVSGPFHTSYMIPAGEALKARFGSVELGEPAFTMLYNCLGKEKQPEDRIQDLLVRQVSTGVQMESILRNIIEAGVDCIVEIGPGRTLAGFARKIDRSVECISITTTEDVKKVLALLSEEAN